MTSIQITAAAWRVAAQQALQQGMRRGGDGKAAQRGFGPRADWVLPVRQQTQQIGLPQGSLSTHQCGQLVKPYTVQEKKAKVGADQPPPNAAPCQKMRQTGID